MACHLEQPHQAAQSHQGQTDVDQGKHLTGLEAKVTRLEAKVDEKFEILHKGQKQITELLTRHLGEPDEETRAGGAE